MNEGNENWYHDQQDTAGTPSPEYTDDGSELAPIEWTASEYVSHQKSSSWFIALGGIAAVVTFIVFLVTRNILSGLVVSMAFMAIGFYAVKQPQTKKYQISEQGILAGDKFYTYSRFKSYSVVNEGAISCIWLRPLRKVMPTVVMYFGPEDEEKIVMMLDNFLAQEDREHDAFDRLSRKIRF